VAGFAGQPPAGLCGSALQQAARAAAGARRRRRRAVAARAARTGAGARAALARPPLLWGMRAAAALPMWRCGAGPDGPPHGPAAAERVGSGLWLGPIR
jgi:hypothetical protein